MRTAGGLLLVLSTAMLLSSCTTMEPPSKVTEGNLELSIEPLREGDVALSPGISIDNQFIGTVSQRKPILYLKPGRHDVRLELPGYKPWHRDVYILGSPNMQYLHVRLEKVANLAEPAETAPPAKPTVEIVPK